MDARVNVGTGNLLLTATDADVAGIAGFNMVLERYYNSAVYDTSDPSNLGPGWSTGLGGSVRLEFPAAGKVSFFNASAARTVFDKNASGDYVAAEPGIKAELTFNTNTSTYRLEFHDKQVYLFDNAGRLTTIRDKQGNELTFAYTTGGNLDTVTDTRDRVAVFSYNGAQGRLNQVEVRNSAGTAVLRYTYTYTGTTPARLTSTRLSYVGAVSTTVDTTNVDARTTYTYDGNGRLLRVKDPREYTTTTDGGTTEFSYDINGRLKTLKRLTDATSIPDSTSSFSYDTDTGSATPCNTKGATRTTVDGERTDVADLTTYCADQHGRVVRTVDAKGNVRSTTWGPNSNVESADMSGLDSGGQSTQYEYDGNDNPTKVTEPSGGQASMAYDDPTNSHAPTAYRDYDVNGAASAPATWAYDYDDNGNLIQAKAAGPGIQYRYCWDGKGQLQRIDAPNANGSSSVSLDNSLTAGCGSDPANQGNDTLHTYNNAGELTSVNRPGPHGDVSYTYDALSRVRTKTDGRGVVATYTYDAHDNVTAISYDGGSTAPTTVQWTYDVNGNLTQLDDTNGTNTFGFDELNRLVTESAQAPSGSKSYAYDPADNLTSVTVAGEPAPTLYTYDKTNKVASVDDQRSTSNVTTFGYDRHDKRDTTRYPIPGSNNDIFQKAVYDDAGRVTCIWSHRENTVPATGASGCPGPSATGLITYYNYSYVDPATGFKTKTRYQVTEIGGRTTAYTYDPISRLQSATTNAAGGAELRKFTYTYDYHSNLTREVVTGSTPGLETGTTSMAFNDADEMCWSAPTASTNGCGSAPAGATTWSYNGSGAMTQGVGGDFAGFNAEYNDIGQMSSFDTSGGSYPRPMAYDGVTQDRRTQADNLSQSYGFSGMSAEASNTGTRSNWFVRDPAGQLVSMVASDGAPEWYYLTDALGSVTAMVKQDGTVKRYAYEPYGQQIRTWIQADAGTVNNDGAESDTGTLSGGDDNPWRYASGYADKNSPMIKFGTRYYIPALSRWTQMDPVAGRPIEPLSMNPYLYVTDNPINSTDPAGRCDFGDLFCYVKYVEQKVSPLILAGAGVAQFGAIPLVCATGFGCLVGAPWLAAGGTSAFYGAYKLAEEFWW